MRIARRRSVALPSRVGAVLGYGVFAGAVVALATTFALRVRPDDSPVRAAPVSPVTMADSIGLSGLSSIGPPSNGAQLSALGGNQVVAYYGSPRTPGMGILGQHTPDAVARLLAQRAARFDELNGGTDVLPTLHLVYAVAQPQANADGTYLRYVDDRTVRQFISLARENGFAIILDLQIGSGSPVEEVRKIEQYLVEPEVFVALDPEFALQGPHAPGEAIGSITASDVNAVQRYLAALTAQRGLPQKMLVVHQFQADMITQAEAIERVAGVDLVIDMDGFGPADIKTVKYQRFGAASYAPHGGIKLFLQHEPDLLSEEAIVHLEPRPAFIVYQ